MAHRKCLPLIAALLIAIAAPNALAQNPFDIDGIVTDADNSGVPLPPEAPGSTKTTDQNGNVKELGPKNASSTKISVIHSAALPMLNTTNPNAQVDLNTVWTQSKVVGADLWFYFAWARDSNSGSGFISIELQKNAPPVGCNYEDEPTDAELIASCNPWVGRDDGDFIILWDQNGGSTDIYVRIFNAAVGAFGTAIPIADAAVDAVYSADGFRGEMAININAIVAGQASQCLSFANIIPGTVTGNSDSADYKDTVLDTFPVASNCGTINITKKTLNGLDQVITGAGPFPFTLDATDPIFGAPADSECTVSGASLNVCSGSLAQGESSVSIVNLLARGDYSLTEGTIDAKWELISIKCDNVSVMGGTFSLAAGQTKACVITNKLKQGFLRVIKDVQNDNGGTAGPGAFTLSIGVSTVPAFQGVGGPDGSLFTLADGTPFNVVETVLAQGYEQLTSIGDCSGAIVANTTQTCTIVNGDKPASLTLRKVVNNTAGGTATEASFTLTAAGPTPVSGPGPQVQNTSVSKGDYTLTESSVGGYTIETDWVCTGDGIVQGANSPAGTGHVTLELGQSAVCTIVNKDSKASPTGLTKQRARLYDKLEITGIRPDAPNALAARVIFTVYSNATCTGTPLGSQIREIVAGVAETSDVGTGALIVEAKNNGTNPATHNFAWTAEYTGDQFNTGFIRTCKESMAITIQDDPGGD